MYLVSGATGNIGSEVVRALLAAGEDVRALVRSTDAAVPDGARPVVGDLDDPDSVRPWLAGVRGVFLLPGYRGLSGILTAAGAAGVERVVLLSGRSAASGDRSNAVSRYMIESEAVAHASKLDATIIRPAMFASNTLQWRDQLRAGDVVRAPFAGVRAAVVHPADIGAVVAAVFADPVHAGRTYPVSGPEASTPAERLAVLGDVLGRRLRLEPSTDAEARVELESTMPREYVDAFFDFYVDGTLDESPVLPTVAEITGRPPRTFRDWAIEHAGAFG